MPRVSVIMPVYNGAEFLREAVDSVLGQSDGDFELLIRDDGSKDASPEIVASYRDPRIRVVPGGTRSGIFGNLSHLVAAASCEEVRILCQDDVLQPDCLREHLRFMAENPALGAARSFEVGRGRAVEHGMLRFERRLPPILHPGCADAVFLAFGNIFGNLSNVLFRKRALAAAGGFQQRFPYAGDLDCWVRLARCAPVGIVSAELAMIRAHPNQGSVTLNTRNELYPQLDAIFGDLYGRLAIEDRPLFRTVLSASWGVARFHLWLKQSLATRSFGPKNLLTPSPVLESPVRLGWRWLLSVNGRRFDPDLGERVLNRISELNRPYATA